MQKKLLLLLTAVPLIGGIAAMEVGERTIAATAYAILVVAVGFLYRRFRRSAAEVPWIFQATAAIALPVGLITMISGMLHSSAVTAVAFREDQWVPLTILRFTTGMLLMYSGIVSVALYRALRAGKHWAAAVSASTTLLFWSYLMFLFPLPGTGGTVPPMLGLWSAFLLWNGATVLTILSRTAAPQRRKHA